MTHTFTDAVVGTAVRKPDGDRFSFVTLH